MNKASFESGTCATAAPELRLTPLRAAAVQLWSRLAAAMGRVKISRAKKDLRVCETVSLGEKRLLAIVEYGGQRMLIGATAQAIVLLPTQTMAEGRVAENAEETGGRAAQ